MWPPGHGAVRRKTSSPHVALAAGSPRGVSRTPAEGSHSEDILRNSRERADTAAEAFSSRASGMEADRSAGQLTRQTLRFGCCAAAIGAFSASTTGAAILKWRMIVAAKSFFSAAAAGSVAASPHCLHLISSIPGCSAGNPFGGRVKHPLQIPQMSSEWRPSAGVRETPRGDPAANAVSGRAGPSPASMPRRPQSPPSR